MCSSALLSEILQQLCDKLNMLLGESIKDVILFGSYARNDADESSDIDVLILADLSRMEIASLTFKLGEIVSDLLLEHGIMVSPIIENRDFFHANKDVFPFFRNIENEGVRISA